MTALVAALGAGLVAAWATSPTPVAEVSGPAANDPLVASASRPTPEPNGTRRAPVPAPPSPTATRPADPKTTRPVGPTATRPKVRTHDASLAAAARQRPAVPTALRIPRLGVDMKVVPVGVSGDGQMALPAKVTQAGWYRYGPAPGDRVGAVVVAGHLDMRGQGTGPLARLGDLRRGDVVTVGAGSGSVRYAVDRVVSIRKAALDLDAIFRRTGPAALHIVTCGGTFDPSTRHYDHNVVVVAVPIR